jgi:hypothetical protein
MIVTRRNKGKKKFFLFFPESLEVKVVDETRGRLSGCVCNLERGGVFFFSAEERRE